MRIITHGGTDIPYEAVVLNHNCYVKGCFSGIEETRYVLEATPIYCADGGHYTLAEYDSGEEVDKTILQIAILAAKGTKLIRMQDSGEIEVVV